jgi:hypothetical protein
MAPAGMRSHPRAAKGENLLQALAAVYMKELPKRQPASTYALRCHPLEIVNVLHVC